MKQWTLPIKSYTMEEVRKYCVNNESWQRFRKSLKQLPTSTKLRLLHDRYEMLMPSFVKEDSEDVEGQRSIQVQTDNYINALKRGGQLNSWTLEVQR